MDDQQEQDPTKAALLDAMARANVSGEAANRYVESADLAYYSPLGEPDQQRIDRFASSIGALPVRTAPEAGSAVPTQLTRAEVVAMAKSDPEGLLRAKAEGRLRDLMGGGS